MAFLEKLGFKKSTLQKLLEERKELERKKALNIDKLEEIREQIGLVTEQIRTKKEQMDLAGSEEKRIIRREIGRLLSRIDSFAPKEDLLDRNIRVIEAQIAKIDQVEVAQLQGVSVETIDRVAVEAEEEFEKLADVDEAIKDMEKIRYESPTYGTETDIDERLRSIEADAQRRGKKQSEESAMDKRLEELLEEE